MAIYIPISQTPYFLQGLFSSEKFAQLMASGAVGPDSLDGALDKGDYITIPQVVQVPDFARVDLTSTAAAAGTRVATNDAKAPIVRDYTMPVFTTHDEIRANENWRTHNAATSGNKMAKNVIQNIDATLQGVINVAALDHLHNAGLAAVTVQDIRKAKKLMGDQYDKATVMLVHPLVFSDIIYDLTTNYKYSGNLSGQWLADGFIQNVMGINKIIVSGDLTPEAGATSSAGDDLYYTWIFAENEDGLTSQPVYFGYQAAPRYEEFQDSRVPSTLIYSKWSMDYVIGVRGMGWNQSTANPVKADLANNAFWTVKCEDARNVGVVAIKSLGGKN
jgi:hypothetical protein